MKAIALGLFCAASLFAAAQADAAAVPNAAPAKPAKIQTSIHAARATFAGDTQSGGGETSCPVLMQTRAHRVVLIRRTHCDVLIQD